MSYTGSVTLDIILGVTAVVAALVAPLYVILLGYARDKGSATQQRTNLEDSQGEIVRRLDGIDQTLTDIRTEVHTNAQRSEQNQRHIHQILVGDINSDEDEDVGNPHYKAEHCPLGDECSWHQD